MSISPPPENWFKAPHGNEKLWLGLAIAWCAVMSIAMPYWHFFGKQNSTGESYKVAPKDFIARVQKFVKTNQVDTMNGFPVVEGTPGGDIYMQGQMWLWYPVLKLKKGQTYRLHLSSIDLNHGFSIQPLNMNFHVLPGYDHVLTITPTSSGEFPIICNEFCGIGHSTMTGRIIVED